MVWDDFLGGEVVNFLFNYFEGFNEGIIGREAEVKGSMVKCWERPLDRGGSMCNSRDASHAQWCYGNCGTPVDYVTRLQK